MQQFKKILVFAGTKDPDTAIKRAFEIAKENDARVTLMDVVKPLPAAISMLTDAATPDELEKLLVNERGRQLVELADGYGRGTLAVDVVVRCGDTAQEIVKRVLGDGHDLVIKTADGIAEGGQMFGSMAQSLLRVCPCPVWMLKPQVHGDFDQVLAAIDIDADDETHQQLNSEILSLASAIADRDNAKLHVVSVWDMWMEQSLRRRTGDAEVDEALAKREASVKQRLDELLHQPKQDVDQVEVHLLRGTASTKIMEVADQVAADLVVMGTVCRTGVAGFLIGNTAETLLSKITCSVLAVKPDGFETPIQVDAEDDSAWSEALPMI